MKRILKNDLFEEYFDSSILSRGRNYYRENRIMDIWYQGDNIFAYVDGSEIYKVELKIKDNEIRRFYCACPYCEDGEYLCKHIAAVLYYLLENDIPELEAEKAKKKSKQTKETELSRIYDEMQSELKRISDRDGFVNYYNGRYFVNLIFKVASKIERFIDNENYGDAFELIKYTYYFIKNTFMDGSNGEYQDSLCELSSSASKLLYDENYYNKFLDWAKEVADTEELGDFSDAPLYAFILYVHDKKSASKVIEILENCEFLYGIFINKILDIISLTYDFIDKEEAIQLCYQNLDEFGVSERLTDYLKKENRTEEIVKFLKNDIKKHVRKDMAYDKLIQVYDENNMFDEKKKLLPEVIIETNDFERYLELKNMCSTNEWESLKQEIISKIKPNNRWLLEDIYKEENEIDKLFSLIQKDPNLGKLKRYQDALKEKYSKELLDFYKPQIIEDAKRAFSREHYQSIGEDIKKMGELKDSSDFIFEMLKEMYPLYKSKRAFKEEIMNVLDKENKIRFENLITSKN